EFYAFISSRSLSIAGQDLSLLSPLMRQLPRDLEFDVHKLGAVSKVRAHLAGHAHLARPAPIGGAVLDEVAQLALGKRRRQDDAAARHTQKRGVQSRPIHPTTRDLNRLVN